MKPEVELILALCRLPLSREAIARAGNAIGGELDWDHCFALAAAWHVEPVVLSNLTRHFAARLPEGVLVRARERERESRALTLADTLVLADTARRLEDQGIPVVVLKGPAIGVAAYGDPSLRPFADFDILVRREDMIRARDAILAMRYERDYPPDTEGDLIRDQHALEFSRPRSKVEVHWALLSRHLRFDLDPRELWGSARKIECAGREIRTLAPHHQFLFVCAHGTKHEWLSPHWIADVAQLASRFDDSQWAEVLHLARRLHARRILALSLRIARDAVGLEISSFAARELVSERETKNLVQHAIDRLHGRPPADGAPKRLTETDRNIALLMYWVRARERLVDRVACLARVAFVPTAADRGPRPWAWAARPIRLGVQAIRRAVQA